MQQSQSVADRGAGTEARTDPTPTVGEVLCDRHRREYYIVTEVDDAGVSLGQDGIEYVVPHGIFCSLYPRRMFPLDESASIDPPAWVTDERTARAIALSANADD